MERSREGKNSPKAHITSIFEDYEASARVLQTLTNLSNTVIETALSGQCKFLFEILQNADDAFDDQSKYRDTNLKLVLFDNYFIIQHNGKEFSYYDVERICDYASQIEEVKANDLSKTGYKGLGFKSLFNLSDCIYICSNGYSFCFDKNYWPDPEKKPWQVIPIWCDNLPLSGKFTYDQPVNFIMKIIDKKELNIQLKEFIDHPEILLYLHRVNSVHLNINGMEHILERKVTGFKSFHKVVFFKNHCAVSTWFLKTYERAIPLHLKKNIQDVSQFIFPDKIKSAKETSFTFALSTNAAVEEVFKIDGFCYSTLPTQLHLSLPYHINSLFILNLDRTQFHENEWNEFLVSQIGYLQLKFLKDLAEIPYLKNFVVKLLVRKINHPYGIFNNSFSRGFEEAREQIAWLPAYKGHLLKLGNACVDKIHFFKQNFENIRDGQCDYVIDYDVKEQHILLENEAAHFGYDSLFDRFPQTYYSQLTQNSYIKFLSYLYESSSIFPLNSQECYKLAYTQFLKAKNGALLSPTNALLEEENNPIPTFAELNPVDNKYLPVKSRLHFKKWLVRLGAKRLEIPVQILRESVFQWINSYTLPNKMNIYNHMAIIDYLAKNCKQFTYEETNMLKEYLLILTKSNKFRIATSCYLPNAITLEELGEIISDDDIISSCYNIHSLKDFFLQLGISDCLSGIKVFRSCIFEWIKNGDIKRKLTTKNYKPILEYLSLEYQKIHYELTKEEKELLKKMPVLTCTQTFQEAKHCFFDTAVPCVKGFEDVIEKSKLVSTQDLNGDVKKFLTSIGVSEKMQPKCILRNSILKWIQDGTMQSRINLTNHRGILKYVAELWSNLYGFETNEVEVLKKLPILTKGDIFREVCRCYWAIDVYGSHDEIPKLESIVSPDELVSSSYYASEEKKPLEVETLLNDLGVRHLRFTDIYDRYCDHLTDHETIKWFFLNLIKYWEKFKLYTKTDRLLKDLQVKLYSTRILAKNGKLYSSKELYSSRFLRMYKIDNNAVPLLAFENLPRDLEIWLGIKQELELSCIKELLESFDKKQNLGGEITLTFFKTILEQLQKKDKTEIREYPLKLLSDANKITLAKDLYYFEEENAVCMNKSCYLKRIHGMSHDETLKLAELCGVNLLPFSQEVTCGEKAPVLDKTLRMFYLERLPLIVLQESKKLNESPENILKKLFLKISCIELYKCENILVHYPFGEPVKTQEHFDLLKVYVVGKWKNLRTSIHMHIKEKLELVTDITRILDIESVAEDKMEWLSYQGENPQELFMIEEQLKKLLSGEEIVTADKLNLVDEGISNIDSSLEQDVGFEQEKVTIDQSFQFKPDNIDNHLLVKQDAEFGQVNAMKINQGTIDFEDKDMEAIGLIVQQNVDTALEMDPTANQIHVFENNSPNDNEAINFDLIRCSTVTSKHQYSKNKVYSDLCSNQFKSENCKDMPLLNVPNFGLEKPTYDNTLREFYIQRLPFIVHWESKEQKHTPEEILKRLYNKIRSIQLYKCSDIHIQYPHSYAAETYCFFDDLKIYVVGKWSDREFKIHNYIKEKLGLCIDVAHIVNLEPVPEDTGNQNINLENDNVQKLHQIEEELKALISAEKISTEEQGSISDKNYLEDSNLLENEEFIVKMSSDGNSKVCPVKPCLSRAYAMKAEGSKVIITFTEKTETVKHYDPTFNRFDEDAIKINLELAPRRLPAYYKKRAKKSFTHKRYSSLTNLHIEPEKIFHGVADDDGSHFKRFAEKYVFHFLQDYYKNKYPDAENIVEHGHFTLQYQSITTEIIWLNEKEDKGLEYDLLLKKNEEVKQYIRVKSVDQATLESFNQNNCIFIRRNQFVMEYPEYDAKYCMYCVLHDSSVLPSEEMTNINALCKVVHLKMPSV